MAEYDVLKSEYKVKILSKSGEIYDMTDFIMACTWGDPAGEIAARANITFSQSLTAQGYVNLLLPLCTPIFIYANGAEVFRGVIWDWDYSCTGSGGKETNIVAYDRMIYANQSKEDAFYTAGKDTRSIVSDICGRWGIRLSYEWPVSHTHEKKAYKNRTIAAEILDTLDDAARKTNQKYVGYMDRDTLRIRGRGSNEEVYVFDYSNSMTIRNKLSLSRLVTRVIVVGKEDSAGRAPIEATVNGRTEYGILQEVIHRDGDSTLADAAAEANNVIAERGKPEETVTLGAPDVPTIRKGDRIKVNAGNIAQTYLFVKGIRHDAVNRSMTVECER